MSCEAWVFYNIMYFQLFLFQLYISVTTNQFWKTERNASPQLQRKIKSSLHMRNVGYVLAPATPSSKIGIIARDECNYKTDVIQT